MSTFDHAARRTAVETPAVAQRVVGAALGFLRAWKNRRAFYRLGEMSDAELADIGLTRTDLSVAVSGIPFGADPTARLGAIRESRLDTIEDIARRVA